jgi:hypothetical protein
MSQNALPQSQPRPLPCGPEYSLGIVSGFPGLSRCSRLRWRLLRHRVSPWFTLAIALLKLPFASEVERIREQARYLSAIARIDFVSVYGLLNDLLW